MGANYFLYEETLINMDGSNENDRVTSLRSVLSHLKVYGNTTFSCNFLNRDNFCDLLASLV